MALQLQQTNINLCSLPSDSDMGKVGGSCLASCFFAISATTLHGFGCVTHQVVIMRLALPKGSAGVSKRGFRRGSLGGQGDSGAPKGGSIHILHSRNKYLKTRIGCISSFLCQHDYFLLFLRFFFFFFFFLFLFI